MCTSSKDKNISFEFSGNKAKHVQRDALKMFVKKICDLYRKKRRYKTPNNANMYNSLRF